MITQTSTEISAGSSAAVRAEYLVGLLNLRQPLDSDAGWLKQWRDRATARIRDLAIPSTRDEEWRFTSLADLLQVQFQATDPQPSVELSEIQPFILPEAANSRLVFVDGVYDSALSSVVGLPDGIIVANLSTALKLENINNGVANFLGMSQGAEEVFTALNTASMTDAAIVWVRNQQEITTPIHILYVSKATQPTLVHPRCFIMAQDFSKLTLVEEFVTLREGVYFTNSVTEISLWNNAEVNHTRIQRDSGDSFHIGKTAVSQDRSSRYTGNAINLGAKLSRHNLEIHQRGEETETTLNGLTLIRNTQLADTHSAIVLTKPHGTANQLHKCIVDDRAHAVFSGKVLVAKAAQLTNATQLNRNLLLSPRARVDTKPQLEIVADNVKCTHGATVGQLETDQVFYLQSRGLDAASAKKLLVYAFAYEILEQIAIDSLRQTLSQLVSSQTQSF